MIASSNVILVSLDDQMKKELELPDGFCNLTHSLNIRRDNPKMIVIAKTRLTIYDKRNLLTLISYNGELKKLKRSIFYEFINEDIYSLL